MSFRTIISGMLIAGSVSLSVFAAELSPEQKAQQVQKQTENQKGIAVCGENGTYYLKDEIAFLARGPLTEGRIAKASQSAKPKNADPLPAIKRFNDDLKKKGIHLLVVPVPPKMTALPSFGFQKGEAAAHLQAYCKELSKAGIDVIDLSDAYKTANVNVYCKTDSHWSPDGIRIAAAAIAGKMGIASPKNDFASTKLTINGDLVKNTPDIKEEIHLYQPEKFTIADNAPVLVMGDSHTLIFHAGGDMLAEKAGLPEMLSAMTGSPVALMGIRGSGATSVRINLYRKVKKDPKWLVDKKWIVWVFAAREFTEAQSGFAVVPF